MGDRDGGGVSVAVRCLLDKALLLDHKMETKVLLVVHCT